MRDPRTTAIQLLSHYITITMTQAGLKVDRDTHTELEECVDAIIDASVQACADILAGKKKA